MAERIREFLKELRLSPHERKTRVYRCDEGLTLLGWRIVLGRMRLARSNVVRMRRRLKVMAALFHAGKIGFNKMHQRLAAWIGHAAFGDTWGLRQDLFEQVILRIAEHSRNARRFLEQQSRQHPRLEP